MWVTIITNGPLSWGMLIMGEAMHVRRHKVYGKSLYFLLNFAVNIKLLLKDKVFNLKKSHS